MASSPLATKSWARTTLPKAGPLQAARRPPQQLQQQQQQVQQQQQQHHHHQLAASLWRDPRKPPLRHLRHQVLNLLALLLQSTITDAASSAAASLFFSSAAPSSSVFSAPAAGAGASASSFSFVVATPASDSARYVPNLHYTLPNLPLTLLPARRSTLSGRAAKHKPKRSRSQSSSRW